MSSNLWKIKATTDCFSTINNSKSTPEDIDAAKESLERISKWTKETLNQENATYNPSSLEDINIAKEIANIYKREKKEEQLELNLKEESKKTSEHYTPIDTDKVTKIIHPNEHGTTAHGISIEQQREDK